MTNNVYSRIIKEPGCGKHSSNVEKRILIFSKSELNIKTKIKINLNWKVKWNSPHIKLNEIKCDVTQWLDPQKIPRKLGTVITRLRTSHTHITHFIQDI